MMFQFLKIVIIYFLRIVLRLLYVFPINKRRIVFTSYSGRQYSCNPKYIFEYAYNKFGDKFEYVWCLNDKKIFSGAYLNIKFCSFLSLRYVYYVMTARYIITNGSIEPFFPLRKNQSVVYTWHGGGAYKKIGNIDIYKWSKLIMRNMRSKMMRYVISSCKEFTKIHSTIWNVPQQIFLPFGMPRNDILFHHNTQITEKIYNYYNIDKRASLKTSVFRDDPLKKACFTACRTGNCKGTSKNNQFFEVP
ncbi:MAG: CDP-glycerol glycerophosphotransferase family protein, partial [Bacteroidales bacterium]|nr:CDP-glycerol glycerophosphotransferase family protein [Bacteroidales bacterium]